MPKPPPHATPPRPDATRGPVLAVAAVLIALPLAVAARRTWGAPQALPARPDALHRIDLNHAPPEQLRLLRGVGPSLAQRIVDDRAARGPFAGADDLRRVNGIGRQLPERWRGYITFGR